MGEDKRFFLISFLICFLFFLFHLFIIGTAVYGDSKYYYATARSLVFDRDLNFENEYAFFNIKEPKTATGYLANKYPPGSSLIWTVPLLLTHTLLVPFSYFDIYTLNNGYSLPYQILTGLMTIFLTIIGLFFLYKILCKFYDKKISFITSAYILFCTNLFFYSSFDVINSHALTFTFSALFFYILLIFKNKTYKWFTAGLTTGSLALLRTQELIFIIPALLFLSLTKGNLSNKIKFLLLFIIGFFITFFPQILIWHQIYGTYYLSPYLNSDEGFNFLKPKLFGLLFNTNTGLIIWTPFVFLAILGLFFLGNNLRYLKYIFLVTLFLQIYLISSWSSWNQGGSFGVRMLISSLPIIAFGIAQIVKAYLERYSLRSLVYLFCCCLLVNLTLIISYLITH